MVVSVHDLRGMTLRTFEFGELAPGRHSIEWDGKDNHGRALPTGVYLIRTEISNGGSDATKVMLVR